MQLAEFFLKLDLLIFNFGADEVADILEAPRINGEEIVFLLSLGIDGAV